MKKDKLIEYIAVIFLFIVLFFDFFVSKLLDYNIILVMLLGIYVLICNKFIKSRKVDNINRKTVTFFMIIFSIIYILILYILGIFVGFYKNPISFNFKVLYSRILPSILIIVFAEIIRSKFVLKNNRIITILITIALIFIDVLTYINLYNFSLLEDVLAMIGYVFFSSVSLNLLFNYIIKRYGVFPNILFKIIITTYIYIFSILPDIYMFFQSALRIIYPYFIYIILEKLFTINNFKLSIKNNKVNFISIICCTFFVIVMVLLISCKFKYGMLVVGSNSMSGVIDKGDVIIFERYDNQELQEGQVIVFYKDEKRIIHEIKEIQTLNDNIVIYTKGRNNLQQDEGYRKEKDIIGIVKFKILYIGWPTIWVNEIFY